jgi:hypothetical protein
MISPQRIRLLTAAQRVLLIRHIDWPVEVLTSGSQLAQSRKILMILGLIRPHPFGAVRPRYTVMTEEGRRAVCIILGDYADALIGAGLLEQEDPVAALRRLQREVRPELPSVAPKPGQKRALPA